MALSLEIVKYIFVKVANFWDGNMASKNRNVAFFFTYFVISESIF